MLDLLAADLSHFWPAHSASAHTGKQNTHTHTHTHHALVRAHSHTHTGSNYTQYTDTGIRTEDGIGISRGRFAVKHRRRANF